MSERVLLNPVNDSKDDGNAYLTKREDEGTARDQHHSAVAVAIDDGYSHEKEEPLNN